MGEKPSTRSIFWNAVARPSPVRRRNADRKAIAGDGPLECVCLRQRLLIDQSLRQRTEVTAENNAGDPPSSSELPICNLKT
jgi:hypothetical protein